jgi:hypothetical protein
MSDYSLKTFDGLRLWYRYFHLGKSTAEPVSQAIFLKHYHVSDPGIIIIIIIIIIVVIANFGMFIQMRNY